MISKFRRSRNRVLAYTAAGILTYGVSWADTALAPSATGPDAACRALVGRTFEGGEVLSAQLVAADGVSAPEHCAVNGRIAGSDINFIARLPTNWNGKAVMGASGGWQGVLDLHFSPPDTPTPLAKGYVDYMTDSGHRGDSSGPINPAFDTSWSTRPEAMANFAGLAHQRVTVAIRGIINQRYGQNAQRTYFQGCSGGGHIALVMAQRYPRLFDGIIAGAPAPNFIGTFLGWQRGAKALAMSGALPSQAKLAALSKAVLEQCDKLDGAKDGIISNPLACSFDPQRLRCKGADNDNCLTDAQLNFVREITTDTVFKDGALLVKGLRLAGHEDDPGNWLRWALPMMDVRGTPSLFNVAAGSVIQVLTRNPNANPLTYSVVDDEINILNLSSLVDAWPGQIAEFGAAGGKLIVWNGTADTPVPFENQILYYDAAVASLGGSAKAQQTIRAYFPPGVNHCGGGAGADHFDYLDALDAWVSKNEPPDGKKITKLNKGEEVLSRPLCPYPTWPTYKGSGRIESASSFTCMAHSQQVAGSGRMARDR
jgi:pimeloyl-ACP methyl ester carboxylesterase